MLNYIQAEYIESGTFVSGEEDCFNLKLKSGTDVVIMKKSDFDKITGFQMSMKGKSVIVKSEYAKYTEEE